MENVLYYDEDRELEMEVKTSAFWRLKEGHGFMIEVEVNDEDEELCDVTVVVFLGDEDAMEDAMGLDTLEDSNLPFAQILGGRQVNRQSFVEGLRLLYEEEPDEDDVQEEIALQILALHSVFEILPDVDPDNPTQVKVRLTYTSAEGAQFVLTVHVAPDDQLFALEKTQPPPEPPPKEQLSLFGEDK